MDDRLSAEARPGDTDYTFAKMPSLGRLIIGELASLGASIAETGWSMTVVFGLVSLDVAGPVLRRMGLPKAADWCKEQVGVENKK